ncbi:MAG: nickel/cobalt transporter [Actinomycetota bacterium]
MTLGLTLWPAVAAIAHPLGNFTINLYSAIRLTPGQVRIDYVVDMAEVPTFQELPAIDADGDGLPSDAELAAWAERKAPELLDGLSLDAGGDPVEFRVVSSSAGLRPGQGSLSILRLEATFAGNLSESGSLEFRDDNFPGRLGWREITAVGEDGTALESSSVPARSVSDGLLSYPQDLLSSPLDVRTATIRYAPGVSASIGGDPASAEVGSQARPGVTGGAFAGLVSRTGLSLPIVALSLLLAVGFGALHAIGPGHGKTLMAAYLVGAGGKLRQAVAVGGAVSIMHTASVLGLGLLVVFAQGLFPPERVYPWLGLLSGVVAIGLGAGLLVVRLGVWGSQGRSSSHAGVDHADHAGDHGHAHSHQHPDGPVLSRKGLLALAVAGGILPSPTALVVLLAAIALHRVAFGLALIGAFSVGLAAALVVVGILALRARELVSRKMSSMWGRLVPVLSASAIVVVGLVLTIRGVTQI